MRLTDCFTDMISYTIFLLKAANQKGVTVEKVKEDLERLMKKSESKLETLQCPREDYLLARFAVFAWIDEAIMGSGWNKKQQWQKDHLQQRFYQTADAGELFFQRLNALGPHQNEVREVFYLCLALGFTGQYCNPGDEILLDQLKTSNLKLITGSSVELPSLKEIKLFPESYTSDSGQNKTRRPKAVSPMSLMALFVPLGLFGALFFIYTFILNNIGETLLSRIH